MICLIRKTPVVPSPEEKVRQALLHFMIESGYPIGLIGVEISLSSLPSLKDKQAKLPKRRADILVFSPETLSPLILIECKAVPLKETAMMQVIGYNRLIQAPYIVIANHHEIKSGIYNGKDWIFNPGFPCYANIIEST